LNYKDQDSILILNSPEEFQPHKQAMEDFTKIQIRASVKEIHYVLLFAVSQKELNELFVKINGKLMGDAFLWVCFPKKSSKNYTSDISRDKGWDEIGKANFEPVRLLAIDTNWSAIRFRKVEYIKTLNRNEKMIISKAGREKKKKG